MSTKGVQRLWPLTISPFTKAGAAKSELFREGQGMLHIRQFAWPAKAECLFPCFQPAAFRWYNYSKDAVGSKSEALNYSIAIGEAVIQWEPYVFIVSVISVDQD